MWSIALLPIAVLLLRSALTCASPTTVGFRLVMPNSTFPSLGEVWEGSVTYDSTANADIAAVGYPQGFPLLSATGTRTVWCASPSAPQLYTLNSTANILGLVPTDNHYYFLNTSGAFPPRITETCCLASDTFYGTLLLVQTANLTNYTSPDGFQNYPDSYTVSDNLYYEPSQVADSMDAAGWIFYFDRPQLGMTNITSNPGFEQYLYVVEIGADDGSPAGYGDIGDYTLNLDPKVDLILFGFNGNITITPAATVLGDPQFMGLRGQSFQVHGMDGVVYSLIMDKDKDMAMNARFVFLSQGSCPSIPAPSNCWTHPGSYLGEIGITTVSGDALVIRSGSGTTGFDSVTLNNQQQHVGAELQGRALHGRFTSAFSLSLTVGNFELVLENSDHFINLVSVRVIDWSALSSHGLLGQTWSRPHKAGRDVKEVEGSIDDYAEASSDLLGHDFMFMQTATF